ncbi:MAG: type II toxin-antitoxin system Phd/YefM family antitoxin [Acidimicrobiales bacterium]
MTTEVSAEAFKAHCLDLLEEVADTGESVIVTRRGRPVARLVPVSDPASLVGRVEFVVSDEELLAPIWSAGSASA